MFEGERIIGLVKSDSSNRQEEEVMKKAVEDADQLRQKEKEKKKQKELEKESKKKKKESSKKQDEYVLSKLFKKDVSALQHDVIEGSSKSTPDYTLVEAEAEKVAKDAINALKRSRSLCFSAVSGIPTWTGLSGKMKGHDKKKETSSSASSSILTAMRNRHRLDEGNSSSNNSTPDSVHETLLTDLRCFIAFQAKTRGEATTEEVLSRFSDLPPHQTPVFRSFLHKICTFQRRNSKGYWVLNQDL